MIKIFMLKKFIFLFTFSILFNFSFNLKLLNENELKKCAEIYPTKKEDCGKVNFVGIVCCFYEMVFPKITNICYGASLASKGLKNEIPKKIILAKNIWIEGKLDCTS